MPLGVPGEIYVGGAGVARGYLDRPGLTAERFVPDPFGASPGGAPVSDRATRRATSPTGASSISGASTPRSRLRGYRIELGEIEAALRAAAGVEEAAVVLREDQPEDQRLVAYIVARSGRALDTGELRNALRRLLPPYMVPATFVELPALSLTPNGKVDRAALPAPRARRQPGWEESAAPQPGIEEQLARIWKQILNVEVVGRHDNFFDAGGHSLLLPRLLSEARGLVDVRKLTIVELFENPTIASLAARIAAAGGLPPVARALSVSGQACRTASGSCSSSGGAVSRTRKVGRAAAARSWHMTTGTEIAIVGMSGRFPGAANVREFWDNLRAGVESIVPEGTAPAGPVDEAASKAHWVKVNSLLEGVDLFDASFFGFNPREAELMDPQHRVLPRVRLGGPGERRLRSPEHAVRASGSTPGPPSRPTSSSIWSAIR